MSPLFLAKAGWLWNEEVVKANCGKAATHSYGGGTLLPHDPHFRTETLKIAHAAWVRRSVAQQVSMRSRRARPHPGMDDMGPDGPITAQ